MQTYLGIDISKNTFDASLLIDNSYTHKVFKNNNSGFEALLSWITTSSPIKPWACLEATGVYGEPLALFCHENNFKISVVNPARIKAYSSSKGLRHKSDKSDSKTIAEFCRSHQPKLWKPLPDSLKTLRELYRGLESLKEDLQRLKNRREKLSYVFNTGSNTISQANIVIERIYLQQIEAIEKEIKKHIKDNDELNSKLKILKQIKGVGDLTAILILSEMPDVEMFENSRQYAAFAGISPKHYRSGTSVFGSRSISRIGAKRIRKALYMPSMVIKNKNEAFKGFCDNLASRGKSPKCIIIAVMRKLLHIVFGMLKHNTSFNPDLAFMRR